MVSIEAITEDLIECRKTLKTAEKEKETLKKEFEKLNNNLAKFTKRKAILDLLLENQILHGGKIGLDYIEKPMPFLLK